MFVSTERVLGKCRQLAFDMILENSSLLKGKVFLNLTSFVSGSEIMCCSFKKKT